LTFVGENTTATPIQPVCFWDYSKAKPRKRQKAFTLKLDKSCRKSVETVKQGLRILVILTR